MTRNPDMLRFTGGVADGEMVGWLGSWPPPAEMVALAGAQTGIVRITERHEIDAETWAMVEACSTIKVTDYRLLAASKLPDSVDHPHVFRGADYVPVEPRL